MNLYTILAFCMGGVLSALIEGVEGSQRVITASVFGGIGIIVAFIILYKKLWSDKYSWLYTTEDCEEKKPVFKGKYNDINWSSNEPQKDGMSFKLDLLKEKLISAVLFDHGDGSKYNPPHKWVMYFLDEEGDPQLLKIRNIEIKPFVNGYKTIQIDRNTLIKPVKARYILVKVTEPAEENGQSLYWNINNIKIRENKFRYINKLI